MITERENLELIFTPGAQPQWIPHMFTAYNFIVPTDVIADRPPFGVQRGKDWFEVTWIWDEASAGFVQDPYEPLICDDVTKWEEQVKFPDLDAVDWEAAAGVVGSVTTDDVIFITSKNAVETKVGDDSYYTYNAVVNGAATTITATSAGKSSIDAAFTGAGNTIGLVTVTSRDGDYVTAVSAEAAAYTSGTLNAKNIASVGNGIIIGTAAIPGTDSKTTMQYNADTQVVILDKDGNVDVDATVDDIDVDYDYVMITPASDNENLADIIYVVQR